MFQGQTGVWRYEAPLERPPPVSIKLDISPNIVPRDTSFGTKILTLVPSEAKTVRDVKSHLAKVVLRTPTPFFFFVGDYRIRDDEDAVIFSLIKDPCRLMPVPMPKPALSSTPKKGDRVSPANDGSSSSNSKRVTFFFDGDSMESPVQRVAGMKPINGVDVMDHSRSPSRIAIVPSPDQFYVAATATSPTAISSNRMNVELESSELNNENEDTDDISVPDKKKKRRRRHRTRKTKKGGQDSEEEGSQNAKEGNGGLNGNFNSANTNINIGNHDEETESEDETSSGTIIAPEDFQFVAPRSSSNRKRSSPVAMNICESSSSVAGVESESRKRKKVSLDSASGSGTGADGSIDSFAYSPLTNESSSSASGGKVRQDTPIVPRVVRNPRAFDTVRKILNTQASPMMEESPNSSGTSFIQRRSSRRGKPVVDGGNGSQDPLLKPDTMSPLSPEKENAEQSQSALIPGPVKTVEEVVVGDVITFHVLELDERYNPNFSDFKEAVVVGKRGNELTLNYIKNEVIDRTGGKYELPDATPDCEDPQQNSVGVLKFEELLECKFVSRSSTTAVADILGVVKTESVSPPPVI